uniref:Titin n=1 Tax=Amphilophus citrinellus TaxID=61819 RepID=A0A3Q0SN39_AMPCI
MYIYLQLKTFTFLLLNLGLSHFNNTEPPANVRVTEVTKNSVSLTWQKPPFDGGSKITGYSVERREAPSDTPGEPVGPITFSNISEGKCTVSWNPPENDGCSEISHYIVEKRETVITKKPIVECAHRVHNLTEDMEYEFRVMAVNDAGVGAPSNISLPIKAAEPKDIPCAPSQTHIVKAGGSVCLGIHFRGKPIPTATWVKEEGELSVMSEITTTDGYSCLSIENCSRNDTGKYTVNLDNPSGSKAITFVVKVMDTPGPPQRLDILDTTDNSVSLGWLKPEHDGGSRIQCYVIEARPKGTDKWVVVGNTKNLTYVVEKLNKGDEYDFRVKAKNESGYSKPKETLAPVLVKEPHIEPAADLSEITNQLITCRSGSTFTIDVPISGRPAPKVTWKENKIPCFECYYKVEGLVEGLEYQFRVYAMNSAGLSKASEASKGAVAQNPVGEF